MPAMLDDPARPTTMYRNGVAASFSNGPGHADAVAAAAAAFSPLIMPRQVTLRDRVTIATLLPMSSPAQIPSGLFGYLCEQLNREIEKGDTYPMIEPMSLAEFGDYWLAHFGAVMLLGEIDGVEDVREGKDWSRECLGSFYIKPNYPGRSSHVCNGGFLVTDAARNRGVGRLMGEAYLEWAPMLGYTYSVFNLVYETNVASCRIWDALGFKRIGRVKGGGNLKSYPDQLIDAIIYGRDLGPEGEDYVSEERFDKIKFYLKHGKYPNGADRAEKSRLRSAATHYKLLDDDRLMLKDKEVIPDAQRQYEIARAVHVQQHGGINKTTATIAEKYHWVRIKETVSLVIRNCSECKELAKAPVVRAEGGSAATKKTNGASSSQGGVSAAGRVLSLPNAREPAAAMDLSQQNTSLRPTRPSPDGQRQQRSQRPQQQAQQAPQQQHQRPLQQSHNRQPPPQAPPPPAHMHQPAQLQHQPPPPPQSLVQPQHHVHHPQAPLANMHSLPDYADLPLDPQIMEGVRHHLTQQYHEAGGADPFSAAHHHAAAAAAAAARAHPHAQAANTIHPHAHAHLHQPHPHPHAHTDFQALLSSDAPHPDLHPHHHANHHGGPHAHQQHPAAAAAAAHGHANGGGILHDGSDDMVDDVDGSIMAAKAAAAARAAHDAMVGLGAVDDVAGADEPMKRHLMAAGYGAGATGGPF